MSDDALDKAKEEAGAARARLFATVHEVQSRLAPANLRDDAVTRVRAQSVRIARTAGDAIRERPAAFGAAALAGALLVGHRPLFRLGRRLFGRREETEDDAAG